MAIALEPGIATDVRPARVTVDTQTGATLVDERADPNANVVFAASRERFVVGDGCTFGSRPSASAQSFCPPRRPATTMSPRR